MWEFQNSRIKANSVGAWNPNEKLSSLKRVLHLLSIFIYFTRKLQVYLYWNYLLNLPYVIQYMSDYENKSKNRKLKWNQYLSLRSRVPVIMKWSVGLTFVLLSVVMMGSGRTSSTVCTSIYDSTYPSCVRVSTRIPKR